MALATSQAPAFKEDGYTYYGRKIVEKRNPQVILTPLPLPTSSADRGGYGATKTQAKLKQGDLADAVAILGAGPGGLYAALILADLGIPFDLIEAQDHVGGRLFTYYFPDSTGAPFNYFDVGAMRFPKTNAMNRVYNLFYYDKLNTPDIALSSKLTPYFFHDDNCFMSYNGVTITYGESTKPGDHFNSTQVILDTPDADAYINAGAGNIEGDVLKPFADAIQSDLENDTTTGWELLMKYDKYSTRAYMSLAYEPSKELHIPPGPLPTDVVNWMETFNTSTGAYDKALSESVLDAIAFGWPSPDDIQFNCLNGGAVQIADAMYKYLVKIGASITFNSRITKLQYLGPNAILVANQAGGSYVYSNVISTIPLPVLRTMDLSKAGLSGMQTAALRQLEYGPAAKVGMQFKTAWWKGGVTLSGKTLNIVGGQSYTDRPARTIVYPSFGDPQDGKTTTLIASYTWTSDATRFSALIENDPDYLKNLMLQELADIHDMDLDFLTKQLIGYKPWSWDNDVYTMGAYAEFGPGEFEDLYNSMTTPAGGGYIQFAGEALSTRHAWVEGAFDSAWRAVYGILLTNPQWEDKRQQFFKNWGVNPEWITPPAASRGPGGPTPTDIFDPEQSLLYRHIANHSSHWQL